LLSTAGLPESLSFDKKAFSAQPLMQESMFCRQCEQTADHYACTNLGICGKTPETAACQDALIQVVKNVAEVCKQARAEGISEDVLHDANVWTLASIFSTLTNVNFSDERIAEYIKEGENIRKSLMSKLKSAPAPLVGQPDLSGMSVEALEEYGHSVGVRKRAEKMNHEDAFSLNELATYGLKGVCAYHMHCHQLGVMDPSVVLAIHEILVKLNDDTPDMNGLLETVMRVGQVNAQVLGILDGAHAQSFGSPEPSQVRTTPVEGKCILISGHDMADLYELLKQTEGTGINVYTHGEMQPAHGYPKLKAFKHLAGNFGTAWQNQKLEFAAFPGPVVVTTNCIMPPRKVYKNRLYSMNEVGVDGVQHLPNRDFSTVIEQAKSLKGFPRTVEPASFVMTGFNHRAVLPLAGKVIEAAQSGALSRIFLIGGCDGSQLERSYFTELAEATPDDSIILTLGCAKNRLIHSKKLQNAMLGDTGLPRVLDMGQCNDSYSAVVVATELAKALNCGVNDLPLSLAVSHLEQKAAAVLCTLLSIGVKNIRLGPSLPAYITPNVLSILQKEFALKGTGNVQNDLKEMMAGQ